MSAVSSQSVIAERREENVAVGAESLNSSDKIATMFATNRWMRIGKIVVASTLLGPLIAGVVMSVELATLWLKEYGVAIVKFDELLLFWWEMTTVAYALGVPYALVTSSAFALLAVLAGWRQLVVALMVSIAPAVLIVVVLGFGDGWGWQEYASSIAWVGLSLAVPATICWYLTRRWHSRTT